MTERMIGKAVCCLMLIVFPMSVLATDAPAAMLFATGSVMLNGSGAPRNTALFAGDSVKTVKDSAATLTANGSTVMVDPDSAIVFRGDGVELSYGAALVTTKKGMSAKVRNLTVAPAGSDATTYRVTRASGRVLVAALRGSVAISDGSTKAVVKEGDSTALPDPQPPQGAGAGGNALVTIPPTAAVAVALGGALIGAIVSVAATGKPSSPPK